MTEPGDRVAEALGMTILKAHRAAMEAAAPPVGGVPAEQRSAERTRILDLLTQLDRIEVELGDRQADLRRSLERIAADRRPSTP